MTTVTTTSTKRIDNALKVAQQMSYVQSEAKKVFLERDIILPVFTATMISGMHGVLYGKPGIAKTAMIEFYGKSMDMKFFAWQLGNGDTSEDLFGPMSLKAMTEEDLYVRNYRRLCLADFALLDEPGKMASSAQNILLRAMNERSLEDDKGLYRMPLHTIWSGSNELFDDNPAFTDRFTTRILLEDVKKADNFWSVVTGSVEVTKTFPINRDHLLDCRFAASILRQATAQDKSLKELLLLIQKKAVAVDCMHTSRRYKQLLEVAAGHALLNGRTAITAQDFTVFAYGLWKDRETHELLQQEITAMCDTEKAELSVFLDALKKIEAQFKATKSSDVLARAAITSEAVELYTKYQSKATYNSWLPHLTQLKSTVESYTGMTLDI